MPKRTPVDREAVLKLYEETKNAQEVARQMGIHPNTVYSTIRRGRGLCAAGCNKPAKPGHVYCEECAQRYAQRADERRKERRRLGLCLYCDERVDAPLSRQLCATHRLAQADRMRERADVQRKGRRGSRLTREASRAKRENWIRYAYKPGGIEAWERDGAACAICRAPFGTTAIHMHHVDFDKTNNVAGNLVCLCFDCHGLVHRLLRCPAPRKVIAWASRVYPGLEHPEGYDAAEAFVKANPKEQLAHRLR